MFYNSILVLLAAVGSYMVFCTYSALAAKVQLYFLDFEYYPDDHSLIITTNHYTTSHWGVYYQVWATVNEF